MLLKLFNSPAKTGLTHSEKQVAESICCDEAKRRSYFKSHPGDGAELLVRLSESGAHFRKVARLVLNDDQVIHDVVMGAYAGDKILSVLETYPRVDQVRVLSRPENVYMLVKGGCGGHVLKIVKDFTSEEREQVWGADKAVSAFVHNDQQRDAFHALEPERFAAHMAEYHERLDAEHDEHARSRTAPQVIQGPYSDEPAKTVQTDIPGPYVQ